MSIQLKRSLTSDIDPAYMLMQGQVGIEMPNTSNSSDTPFKLKIGDGIHSWSDLPYFSGGGISVSATQPTDTKLVWIDTSIGGVLKYYNGSSWVPTKAVWG